MTDYQEFTFHLTRPENYRDIFIALLSDAGFEGFVETEKGFYAYTNQELNPDEILHNFKDAYTYQKRIVVEENWNKEWEKHIKALEIGKEIYIKTSFHPDKDFPMVVTIDPKMSFGTGHHETTYLMIQQLLNLSLPNQSVLDMGAGTGVLSIIAFKFGANPVFAVDNDKWAYQNMIENFEKNNTKAIKSFLGDAQTISAFPDFDIILANINRNILLRDIPFYVKKLKSNGKLILSGFYTQDLPLIQDTAQQNGMVFERKLEKNNWLSAVFQKK